MRANLAWSVPLLLFAASAVSTAAPGPLAPIAPNLAHTQFFGTEPNLPLLTFVNEFFASEKANIDRPDSRIDRLNFIAKTYFRQTKLDPRRLRLRNLEYDGLEFLAAAGPFVDVLLTCDSCSSKHRYLRLMVVKEDGAYRIWPPGKSPDQDFPLRYWWKIWPSEKHYAWLTPKERRTTITKLSLDQAAKTQWAAAQRLRAQDDESIRLAIDNKFKKPAEPDTPAVASPTERPVETRADDASEMVFTGDLASLMGGRRARPEVISADAPIFNKPPVTDNAPFFRTAPGGFAQVFHATLVAFEHDIAEAYVPNGIGEHSVTIRCRVTNATRGIAYRPQSQAGIRDELEWMLNNPTLRRRDYDTTGDQVKEKIGKPVKIAAAGEACAHLSFP